MTTTVEEVTRFVTDTGLVVTTNGDYRFTWNPNRSTAMVSLGTLSPSGVPDSEREYDASALMYELVRASCAWEGDGRDLAIQATINCEYQIRESERLRRAVASRLEGARDAQQQGRRTLAEYKAKVREAVMEAYSSHKHHISRADLNEFLDDVDLEREPTEYEVTVKETATRTGTVTVEATDEDAAVQMAYGRWENDDGIDWDDWDAQESDTDEYEVEEQ